MPHLGACWRQIHVTKFSERLAAPVRKSMFKKKKVSESHAERNCMGEGLRIAS